MRSDDVAPVCPHCARPIRSAIPMLEPRKAESNILTLAGLALLVFGVIVAVSSARSGTEAAHQSAPQRPVTVKPPTPIMTSAEFRRALHDRVKATIAVHVMLNDRAIRHAHEGGMEILAMFPQSADAFSAQLDSVPPMARGIAPADSALRRQYVTALENVISSNRRAAQSHGRDLADATAEVAAAMEQLFGVADSLHVKVPKSTR